MNGKGPLLVAAGLLFFIIILGFYNINISSTSLKHEVQVSNRVAASTSAEFIQRDLEGILERTDLLLAQSGLISAIMGGKIEIARNILSQFVVSGAHVDRAFVTNFDGILWTDYPSGSDNWGQSYADREWFSGVKKYGLPYVSDVFQDHLQNKELSRLLAIFVVKRTR